MLDKESCYLTGGEKLYGFIHAIYVQLYKKTRVSYLGLFNNFFHLSCLSDENLQDLLPCSGSKSLSLLSNGQRSRLAKHALAIITRYSKEKATYSR